jgi:hypothetical protein
MTALRVPAAVAGTKSKSLSTSIGCEAVNCGICLHKDYKYKERKRTSAKRIQLELKGTFGSSCDLLKTLLLEDFTHFFQDLYKREIILGDLLVLIQNIEQGTSARPSGSTSWIRKLLTGTKDSERGYSTRVVKLEKAKCSAARRFLPQKH